MFLFLIFILLFGDSSVLEAGKPIKRDMAGGESHTYQVNLSSGQYLHVIVDQQGMDVIVAVSDQGGKLFELDSPNGANGPEHLFLVAETTGIYSLQVYSPLKSARPGRYEIKIEELRLATAEDRDRAAAHRAYAEGMQLREQRATEARQQAIKKFETAISLFQKFGDRIGEIDALNNIGTICTQLGLREKSLKSLEQALEISRAGGFQQEEAITLHNMGENYIYYGELQKALESYQQALPLRRIAGDKQGEAMTLNNMGLAYRNLGEHQKAIDYYNQLLPIIRDVGDRSGEALALNNLGLAYDYLGDDQKALDYYEQSLPIRREVNDRRGEAVTLNNMGLIYSSLGEKEKALDYFNNSLKLRRDVGDKRGESATLNNLAGVYASAGENQKALEYYNQALLIRHSMGDRAGEATTLSATGLLYRSLGDIEKALDYFNQSLPLSHAVGDREQEARTLFYISKTERDRGNLSLARAKIEEAINIVELSRSKVNIQDLRTSYFASKQDYYALRIDLLMQLHKKDSSTGYNTLALQTSEQARARTLLETLNEARADIRQGADPKLVDSERVLQQQLNITAERQLQLLNGKHTKEQAEEIDKQLRELSSNLQQVQAQIRRSSPRYAELTQPQPLGLKEIQKQLLDPDTVLLEYALGNERSYLWLVTNDSISSYELPKREEIEIAARRVYSLFSAGNQKVLDQTAKVRGVRGAEKSTKGEQFTDAASTLSNMLLGPVASQLGTKRLLIVTEGALQFVPFGALPISKDNTPLIVNNEVINLPSASTIAVLRQEIAGRKPAPKTLAVIADPVFTLDDERVKVSRNEKKPAEPTRLDEVTRSAKESGLADSELHIPRLLSTRQEAARILALVPSAESRSAIDFEANRTTALSSELSQYRIIHFATHGLFNSVHPELSGLMLSMVDEQGRPQNGFLRAHEIFNLNLPADLIVLSACQTGLGRQIRGEGLIGLTRGFMYAGAARVVVSLWNVNDKATAELMARFYQNMISKKGMPPAAALRAAQISMWQDKRWHAPFYWAAFQLQGEWK